MEVKISLDNLEDNVRNAIEENIETVIKEQVDKTIKETVESLGKDIIKDAVSKNFQQFVDDYIKTTVIKNGSNDYWGDDEVKEYTVEQYVESQLKDRLESKTLTVKHGYETEEVSFEDYIKKTFKVNTLIKDEIREYMDDVRKNINETMKETFNESTKNMLSSAVLNILNSTDTYRKIENQIKCIADKKES
jgi:hypothetical protein